VFFIGTAPDTTSTSILSLVKNSRFRATMKSRMLWSSISRSSLVFSANPQHCSGSPAICGQKRFIVGDFEILILSRSPRFRALLDKSRRSIEAGKGLSQKDFWKAARQRKKKKGNWST